MLIEYLLHTESGIFCFWLEPHLDTLSCPFTQPWKGNGRDGVTVFLWFLKKGGAGSLVRLRTLASPFPACTRILLQVPRARATRQCSISLLSLPLLLTIKFSQHRDLRCCLQWTGGDTVSERARDWPRAARQACWSRMPLRAPPSFAPARGWGGRLGIVADLPLCLEACFRGDNNTCGHGRAWARARRSDLVA